MNEARSFREATLPMQCQEPYRQAVAQRPKNFAIERVEISPDGRAGLVRNSATTAVPTRFYTTVHLSEPRLSVGMDVRVAPGGQAYVTEIRIEVDPRNSISTTLLRRVLIDQMLRKALVEASVPIENHPEVRPGAFQIEGTSGNAYWVSPDPAPTNDRVRLAAQVYGQALTAGSKAPTEAVALELHVSKATASRLVRSAREAGLLPAPGAGGPYSPGTAAVRNSLIEAERRRVVADKIMEDARVEHDRLISAEALTGDIRGSTRGPIKDISDPRNWFPADIPGASEFPSEQPSPQE